MGLKTLNWELDEDGTWYADVEVPVDGRLVVEVGPLDPADPASLWGIAYTDWEGTFCDPTEYATDDEAKEEARANVTATLRGA